MSGAGVILAVNLSVAVLFATAFILVAVSNRTDRVAPWFALAYGFGILYLLFEFALPLQAEPRLIYVCGFAAFLGAVTAVTVGIARRYGRPVPWWLLAGLCAAFVLLTHVEIVSYRFRPDEEEAGYETKDAATSIGMHNHCMMRIGAFTEKTKPSGVSSRHLA